MNGSTAKWMTVLSAIILIALGILQNPAPMGFETRPASEIPSYFFAIFAIALILDIAMVLLALWRPKAGSTVSVLAAVLNVIPTLGDQAHLLHSAPTPTNMLVLELLNVVFAILLVVFAFAARPKS